MKRFQKLQLVTMLGLAMGLAGCGGDDAPKIADSQLIGDTETDPETSPTGSSTNDAYTIVLTYPRSESVENLGGGVYRRLGKAIVTDNDGNPVPDGTKISLNIIDSVIAQGTIDGTDKASGSTLVDADPKLGSGAAGFDFTTAYVERNQSHYTLGAGDLVLLTSLDGSLNADSADKKRTINSDDGSIISNTLTLTKAFKRSYPDDVYKVGTTDYVAGVSALGAMVLGANSEGEFVTEGMSETKNGVASFYVTYPATRDTILSGCIDSSIDTRALPAGSARVYLVASASEKATTIDDRFCFTSIAGWVISEPANKTISGSTAVTMFVEDGGDGVHLPFITVTGSVTITKNGGTLDVSLDNSGVYTTNKNGYFTSTVTVSGASSGDTATITYSTSGDAKPVTIDLKIP